MNVLIIFSVCVTAALVSYNIVECFVKKQVYSTSRCTSQFGTLIGEEEQEKEQKRYKTNKQNINSLVIINNGFFWRFYARFSTLHAALCAFTLIHFLNLPFLPDNDVGEMIKY